VSARDALRQIIQSQMWTSPFRHIPSHKTQRLHSNMLAQVEFDADPMCVDAKDDEDDADEDVEEEDDEMLCNEWMELINMEAQSDELYNILLSTMRGEGNTSVLLFGRNGFGKSALLSSVMQRIRVKCGRDSFVYIYLNANLQSTDVDSLYEIVSQLARQNGRYFNVNLFNDEWKEQEAEDQKSASPEEQAAAEAKKKKFKKADFVDNLEYLVDELKKVTMDNFELNNKAKKPIYIVLDNFELFARRHKQTLLYNLFDLNQSNSSLLNIIGITQKKSVYESLEKRIRSRFIHKKIFVPDKCFLADASFTLFYKIVYNALIIPNYTRYYAAGDDQLNGRIKALVRRYNEWVETQVLDNKEVKGYFRALHRQGYPPSKFLVIAGMLSAALFDRRHFLQQLSAPTVKGMVESINDELFHDPFLRMIRNLSINALVVLVVAAKFDLAKNDKFNFEIIYQTLQNVQREDSMMIIMEKHCYFQCYRQLLSMQFLVPVSNANRINVGNTSSSILSKIFHANFDMVRLNKLTDGGAILGYVSKKIEGLPAWINSWLTNQKTHICF